MNLRECRFTNGAFTERLDEFSGDLADWVDPAIIVEATLRAAEETWGTGTISPNSFPSAAMGALLACCYSRAIYESGEIALRLAREPGWGQRRGKAWPDSTAIRQFRRGNLDLLRKCLARVLEQLCARGFCGVRGGFPPATARNDSGNGFQLHPECIKGADLRLMLAVQADSMALDD
jgi:hypothetical protein